MSKRLVGVVLLSIGLGAACDDGPTTPSRGFTLTCPAPVSVQTIEAAARVSFADPVASGGVAPVTTSCTPASGSSFPVGATTVNCQATDARAQTASCQTTVAVVRLPSLGATHFLAFGDSITAGEVTVPMSRPGTPVLAQVVVPGASYPTQLLSMLQGRYTSQAGQIAMVNAGRSGESVVAGVPRLAQLLANGDHDVLLLLDGYNDLLGFGAAAIPRVARALDDMAREARARGVRVYLAQLTPSIPGRQRSIPDAVIREMNDEVRAIAIGEGAELVDLYSPISTDLTRYIGVDGLHPTEAGYQRMAETFFSRIRETLEPR